MLKCRRGTYDSSRSITGLSMLLCAAAMLPLASAAFADGNAVTQAREDVGRSNTIASDIQLPLTMVWKTTTKAAPKSTQQPLYKDGIIYFAMARNVYAIRASDGTTLWTYSGSSPFNASAAMSSDALFVGSDDSHLYKLSLKDGSVLWNKSFSAQIRSAPAVANGRVYFGDENGDVYAVDAATGNTLWDYLAGGAVSSPVVLDDSGKIFFAAADSKVYCLNGDNGEQEWQLLFDADLGGSPPCFANDSLYIAAGRELYALNPNRGALRWRAHFSGQVSSAPTVSTDTLFVATDDNKIVALNVHGSDLWSADIGRTSTAAPLLAGNTLIVTTDYGAMYALDAATGARKWDYVVQPSGTRVKPASVDLCSSPILADGTLYVLGDDGSLSAFKSQALDQAAPVIYDVTPKPGSSVSASALNLAATVVDEGSGIAPDSLLFTIDGKPVSAVAYSAATNGVRTTVDPLALPGPNTPELPALKDGTHTAVMKLADWKGNTVTKTWSFRITNAGQKTAAEQAVEDNQTIVEPPDANTPTTSTGAGGTIAGGGAAGAAGNGGGGGAGARSATSPSVGAAGSPGRGYPVRGGTGGGGTGGGGTGGGGTGGGGIPAPPPPPI